ncbi:DnaJ/Hsp40 cysteine-rich domain superfamily protein [Quillaja saponaria]|uniref:DnaJ/Hsp40 cysteine-rich domain superfamily protein n=1 Tax=Quillaja saponaria TaxID=32244 RepID=A0AAD7VDT6_QUISA|nr:DnaJ/Hsp40 cysteine-rich domain superfamily protein [Quillaja saponaria]
MDSATLKMASSINGFPNTLQILNPSKTINFGFLNSHRRVFISRICAISPNGSASEFVSHGSVSSGGDVSRGRSSLESLFCYDKAIPEERIEKPVGVSLAEKVIGDNPRCTDCHAKGAVLCTTCSGSGLYVDAILESQGIIVKVRCLGCGGTGNIMCTECGGRGHLGH